MHLYVRALRYFAIGVMGWYVMFDFSISQLEKFTHFVFNFIGILTRNGSYDLHHSTDSGYVQRRKICDAIAVSSIFENCAGVDTAQNRYLGLKEFREFLEDYQEEHLDDPDIISVIQVTAFT